MQRVLAADIESIVSNEKAKCLLIFNPITSLDIAMAAIKLHFDTQG